jgi:hypothetical protein
MNWEPLFKWLESLEKHNGYLMYQLVFWVGVIAVVTVYYVVRTIQKGIKSIS